MRTDKNENHYFTWNYGVRLGTLLLATCVTAPAFSQQGVREFWERLGPKRNNTPAPAQETQVPAGFMSAPGTESSDGWTPVGTEYSTPSSTMRPEYSGTPRRTPAARPQNVQTSRYPNTAAPSPAARPLAQMPASAQNLPNPYPVEQKTFRLPYGNILAQSTTPVQELRLYASGNLGKTWDRYQVLDQAKIAASPEKAFDIETRRDGEYWFALRTVTASGLESPSGPYVPTWRIIVNSTGKPLPPTAPAAASGPIQRPAWTPNPDGTTAPVPTPDATANMGGNPGAVVFSVKDVNSDVPDTTLNVYKIQRAAPVLAAKERASGYLPSDGAPGLEDSAVSADSEGELLLPLADSSNEDSKVRCVSEPRLTVDYDIASVGASGVGRVELWGTLDGGQTWTFLTEDKDCTSPITVDLKTDGEYGLTILVFNGAGVGAPRPEPGSLPQMQVVLDRINPTVQIQSIQLVADFGEMEIQWSAQDLHLGSTPVLISWASEMEGPWQPMTPAPIENSGLFSWRIPKTMPGKIFVRMDVSDLAKNTTTLVTGPVITDLVRPTATIRDAKPAE